MQFFITVIFKMWELFEQQTSLHKTFCGHYDSFNP